MQAILDSFRGKSKYIFFSTVLFAAGAVLGYAVFWQNPKVILSNLDRILGNILKISDAVENANKLYVLGLIFQNNLRALLVMVFGGVAFGLVPLFAVLFNGFVVGLILALNFYSGQSLSFFLAALLPHGILELPAILVGAAFGFKIGFELFSPRGKTRFEALKENLKEGVLALGILIPVLFLAALIEAVITPLIARSFL
ncbi:stage II sporulation protein M [Thermosediminibacter litoriperuensis]|uniref:Stage II sporulation protein M n=1 Tax=Thermosediminibacter litoriperuensis TaxID=291989 RepID=A0A5S5ATX6_9FIRM|nr:stage II sporulation protein M [Thermosediminibacter litoriperuensis]TYP54968.1 stage II sporulation protein M [Thermosediminibacter litoriperuensis]